MIYIIKLNDSRYGLSSNNYIEYNNTILMHYYFKYYNINITNFDYIPEFGISNNDWYDDMHWSDDYYKRWVYWIVSKIKNIINYNSKNLIISDSTIDYSISGSNLNRKIFFYNKLTENNINCRIIAKGGGGFTTRNNSSNFINLIYKEKIKYRKYSNIIVIGGINDTFCKNKKVIKKNIKRFSKIAKYIL